ncbi:hypothetical protein HanPI659440_Chr09g0325411 [Helianthus annuus]|nr:hypothetical protein HanPI659440_Chr09g0325411 [Helianthus annuus]
MSLYYTIFLFRSGPKFFLSFSETDGWSVGQPLNKLKIHTSHTLFGLLFELSNYERFDVAGVKALKVQDLGSLDRCGKMASLRDKENKF